MHRMLSNCRESSMASRPEMRLRPKQADQLAERREPAASCHSWHGTAVVRGGFFGGRAPLV
jgi:hypothetical protein